MSWCGTTTQRVHRPAVPRLRTEATPPSWGSRASTQCCEGAATTAGRRWPTTMRWPIAGPHTPTALGALMASTSMACLTGNHYGCREIQCACRICHAPTPKPIVRATRPKVIKGDKPPSRSKRYYKTKAPGERRVDLGKPRGVLKTDPQKVDQVRQML